MGRRIIALDTSTHEWQLAVASSGKSGTELDQLASFIRDENLPVGEQLREALGFDLEPGDRLALSLPARSALVRWLSFPFREARKIAAATPSELARQLPCELNDQQICQQRLSLQETDGSVVLAAAVSTAVIAERLAGFDDHSDPVSYLGLTPFAQAEGLGPLLEDGLLVVVSGDEIILALQQHGELRDLRIQPRIAGQPSIDHVEFILRQGRVMLGRPGEQEPRLTLLGEPADSALVASLRAQGLTVTFPDLTCQGVPVMGNQAPVAALALAGATRERSSLNFRRGPFALTGEWQGIKKKLFAAGGLLAACLMLFIAAGWVQYSQRSSKLDELKQSMDQSYRKVFPKEKTIVDVAMQMEAKLRELRKQTGQLGAADGSALKVLQEVSNRCPTGVTVDIREYNYTPTGLRLGGTTVSFDAVTRIARSLQESPLFDEVKISDTQQKLEGERVEFRLQISFAAPGGVS